MTKQQKHYNSLWVLIHKLERELLKKGMTMKELDKMREETIK